MDPRLPRWEEWIALRVYLVSSLVLGLTARFGFAVSPAIYHNAAAIWHARSLLTDAGTCALPLFNWALVLAALGNFTLFLVTWLKPGVPDRRACSVCSLLTVLIACAYIMNVLMAYYMTPGIFPT